MAQIIPTTFLAVNQMTGPLGVMNTSLTNFNNTAANSTTTFGRLDNVFAATSDQLLGMAGTAAIATAAIGALFMGGKALLENEDAIASFHTIVSDLNEVDFARFTDKINQVAFDTKKTTIDVAQSFEKIAGLNASFADTADGLGLVSNASITLAKASGMELGPAAANMVGIMNQFNYGVEQADRTINALAAGTAVGAASISQTAESLANFGAVAAKSNLTLEQSVGLIQLMASKSQFGADAGSRLRSSIEKLGASGYGYKNGVFSLDVALTSLQKKFNSLGTEQQKNAMLLNIFGQEQITTGSILLSGIDKYKAFTAGVTGTAEAEKAAAIMTGTLSYKFGELRDSFINQITTSKTLNVWMGVVKKGVGFLTDNMDSLLTVTKLLIEGFVITKTIMYGLRAATWAVETATIAYTFTQGALTAATAAYNTQLALTPELMPAVSAGFVAMNTAAGGLLLTLGRIAAVLAVILIARKVMDESEEHNKRLAAIDKHLPEGVDKQKFNDQFHSMTNPGKLLPEDRAAGIKEWYPQSLYDSLNEKYYEGPKREQDSIISAAQDPYTMQQQRKGKDGDKEPKEKTVTININNKATGIDISADAGQSMYGYK